MTDPTPTEPHHDAVALAQRLDVLSYDLMVGGQDNAYRSTLALSGIPDMRRAANLLRNLAAVSAAAPDERDREAWAQEHARVRRARRFDHHRYDDKPPQPNDYVAADVTLAALAARPAPTVSAADVDVWAEWLVDIGYPFDISFPENPPPVDHAVLARLWNERDDWRISDDDAEACVRYEAGLTVADEGRAEA